MSTKKFKDELRSNSNINNLGIQMRIYQATMEEKKTRQKSSKQSNKFTTINALQPNWSKRNVSKLISLKNNGTAQQSRSRGALDEEAYILTIQVRRGERLTFAKKRLRPPERIG
ncbi:uncharacterized protein LOC108094374 [Drosophila ficusphila]|uniref:uncharacterized protein LOC108094374 n=1 Tax=Drosophila ficusphila TaxID=30025 RepID=UPI0007E73600|nr:uncharacterized protein LOC108094374 [Drosophila ficusphila]